VTFGRLKSYINLGAFVGLCILVVLGTLRIECLELMRGFFVSMNVLASLSFGGRKILGIILEILFM
jgi:hypothetical protein